MSLSKYTLTYKTRALEFYPAYLINQNTFVISSESKLEEFLALPAEKLVEIRKIDIDCLARGKENPLRLDRDNWSNNWISKSSLITDLCKVASRCENLQSMEFVGDFCDFHEDFPLRLGKAIPQFHAVDIKLVLNSQEQDRDPDHKFEHFGHIRNILRFLKQSEKAQSLDLSYSSFLPHVIGSVLGLDPYGIPGFMSDLSKLTRLQSLDFSACHLIERFNDAEVELFCDALSQLTGLQKINLYATGIIEKPAILGKVCDALDKCPELKSINFGPVFRTECSGDFPSARGNHYCKDVSHDNGTFEKLRGKLEAHKAQFQTIIKVKKPGQSTTEKITLEASSNENRMNYSFKLHKAKPGQNARLISDRSTGNTLRINS